VLSLIVSDICTREQPAGYPAYSAKYRETRQTHFFFLKLFAIVRPMLRRVSAEGLVGEEFESKIASHDIAD
jgi:hypothetical protein